MISHGLGPRPTGFHLEGSSLPRLKLQMPSSFQKKKKQDTWLSIKWVIAKSAFISPLCDSNNIKSGIMRVGATQPKFTF